MSDIGDEDGAVGVASAASSARRLAERLRERYESPPRGPLGQDQSYAVPAMAFVLPPPQPAGDAGQEPSQTGAEAGGGGTAPGETQPAAPPEPGKADARAVADRVYELMKQEILLARQRGGA